jgi:hypothetical protein
MPDYSKGKMYSIRFYDNDKLIYIGSTIQTLSKRYGSHKLNFECSLYQYIQENYNGDFKCCYIELLEPFECNNKNELDKKEGELIRNFKADNNYIVINRKISGRDKKEYYQDNADKIKEQKKEYYQENADKIKEQNKQYYQDNKEKLNEKHKQYYQDNTDKMKDYYQVNKDKIKEQKKQYRQRKKAEAAAANK